MIDSRDLDTTYNLVVYDTFANPLEDIVYNKHIL